jgi:uncharacterized membrane protein
VAVAVAQVERSRRIDAPTEQVYAHIADVAGIVAMLESLRSWEAMDDQGAYRFTLRSYSALGYRFQPVAELRMTWTSPQGVTFEPVGESATRAAANGSIELQRTDGRTTARIHVDLRLELPIPRLLTGAAGAVLRHELSSGFDRMLRRLDEAATA